MRNLGHLLAYVAGTPWAMHPARGRVMLDVLLRRASGVRLSGEEIETAVGSDQREYAARVHGAGRASGAAAVLPIYGTIVPRAHDVGAASGGGMVSAEAIGAAIGRANSDPNFSTIVLDIDSPGGAVNGIEELAKTITESAKPVVAVVNSMAASAAYWLACAANEIVVTPSGEVGSIGVYCVHDDISKALAEAGVSRTIISAGAHKVEGNNLGPLDDEARAQMQSSVDRYYGAFTGAVAKGRRVAPKVARGEQFGEGRMFGSEEAVARGMVDRVGTLDETLARIAAGGRIKPRAHAEIPDDEIPAVVTAAPIATLDAPAPEAAKASDPKAFEPELDFASLDYQ